MGFVPPPFPPSPHVLSKSCTASRLATRLQNAQSYAHLSLHLEPSLVVSFILLLSPVLGSGILLAGKQAREKRGNLPNILLPTSSDICSSIVNVMVVAAVPVVKEGNFSSSSSNPRCHRCLNDFSIFSFPFSQFTVFLS